MSEMWEMGKSNTLLEAPNSEHYKTMGIEPIQYIEANGLDFHEGNIIKYVSRWKHKGGIDDLKKAKFYIDRLIKLAHDDKRIANSKEVMGSKEERREKEIKEGIKEGWLIPLQESDERFS